MSVYYSDNSLWNLESHIYSLPDEESDIDWRRLFPYILLLLIALATYRIITEKIDTVVKVILVIFFAYMFFFFIKYLIFDKRNVRHGTSKPNYDDKNKNNDPYDMCINYLPNRTCQINNVIKLRHKNFDENEFLGYVNGLYMALMLAKSQANIDTVSPALTPEIIDKFNTEFNMLKSNGVRNIIKDVFISQVYLTSYFQDKLKETVTVFLVSTCMDYLVNIKTESFIRGNRDYKLPKDYKLVFEYNNNRTDENEVVSCPNCGAPITNRYLTICKYCNYTVPFKNNEWLLCNIQPVTIETVDEQIIVDGNYFLKENKTFDKT